MPRPPLRLSVETADDLLALLQDLNKAAGDEDNDDTIRDWRREINRAYWLVRDAHTDADVAAYSAKAAPRDTQKAKVYRAERLVDGLAKLYGVMAQRDYLDEILAADWFKTAFPDLTHGLFVVKLSPSAHTSTHQFTGKHILALIPGADQGTVLHELAHAMHRAWYGSSAAGHDANFVGMLLWLYAMAFPKPTASKLAQGIITAGVKYKHLHAQRRTQRRPAVASPTLVANDPISAIAGAR